MAFSARDLWLTVRARDYASHTLRGVSQTLNKSSRATAVLTQQRQSLQLAQQALRNQRSGIANEISSIQTGARRVALNKAIATQATSHLRIQNQIKDIEKTRLSTASQLKTALAQQSRLGRYALAEKPRAVKGFTIAETKQLYEGATTRVQALQEAETSLERRADLLNKVLTDQLLAVGKLDAATAALITREGELDAALTTVDDRLVATQMKLGRVNKELSDQRILKWTNAAKVAGREMALFGGVATAAFAMAAIGAAKFGTQTTFAATQFRQPGQGTPATLAISAKLNDIVLKQMKEFPASSKDMAQSLYEIGSGTNVSNIGKAANMLGLFNRMAVAGQAPLLDMTQAGITLYNNFGHLAQNANLFFAAVRFGRMTADEYANSLGSVVSIAKLAGNTFTDVSDAMAFLTRQNKNAKQDATGLARLYQLFSRKEMVAGFHSMGIEIKDLHDNKMRPLLDIIRDIAKSPKTPKTGPDLLTYFKTVSALGGRGTGSTGLQGTVNATRVFGYAIQGIKQYQIVAKQVNSDNNELAQSFAALNQSPGVRWADFLNNLKVLVITIGQGALPAFGALADRIRGIADWFNNLSPGTKRAIGEFGVLISVGVLVGGVLLTIVGGLGALVVAFRGFSFAAEEGSAAVSGVFALALIGVLFVMIKFHTQVWAVIRAIGGLKAALIFLAIVIGTFKLASFIAGLEGIGVAAESSVGGVVALTGALTALAAEAGIALGVGLAGLQVYNFLKKPHGKVGTFEGETVYRDSKGYYNMSHQLAGGSWKQILLGEHHKIRLSAADVAWMRKHGFQRKEPVVAAPGQLGQLIQAGKAAEAADKVTKANGRTIATLKGVSATPSFQKLYANYVRALQYEKTYHGSLTGRLKAEEALANAQIALENNVNVQKARAAEKAAKKQIAAQTAALKKEQADAARAAKQQADTAESTFQTALGNMMNMYDTFLQNEQSAFGTLFSGAFISGANTQNRINWGQTLGINDLTKDLSMSLSQFRTWHSNLDKLKKRGAPQSLIDQIVALGPQAALKNLETLNSATPAQLKKYVALWKASQAEIQKQAKLDLNKQIAQYKHFGSQVALAIIAGIQSQNVGMENVLRNMLTKMFPDLVAEAAKSTKTPGPHSTSLVPHTGRGHGSHHTHYHVTVGDTPQIKSQLKSAHWSLKNRTPGI